MRDERGQVLIVVALLFVAILAGTAYAIDAGRFKRDNRRLQQAAEAAAIAGARYLPAKTAGDSNYNNAISHAQDAGNANLGQPVSANGDAMSSSNVHSVLLSQSTGSGFYDTITVTVQDTRTGKMITGVSGTGQAIAAARVYAVNGIAGSLLTPLIANYNDANPGSANWGQQITITSSKDTTGQPGNFDVVVVPTGTVTAPTDVNSRPGAGNCSGCLKDIYNNQIHNGDTLLIPVYDHPNCTIKNGKCVPGGANVSFHIVGFAAFHVDQNFGASGNSGSMKGEFVGFETQASGSSGQTDFGLTTMNMIQ